MGQVDETAPMREGETRSGLVVRLAGIEPPVTKIFDQEVITIGTATDCDLRIDSPTGALPPDTTIITLRRREAADPNYRITTVEAMAGMKRCISP